MTDEEARRADRFISAFREMIASTVVDHSSSCANEKRDGLERIAATVDQVNYTYFANLANIDAVLQGALLDLIEVRLMCVGGGPTLDYNDATDFLAAFEPMVSKARKRMLQ